MTTNTATLADRLGEVRAQIKLLQSKEEELKKELNELLADGEEIFGENYKVVRSEFLSERLNGKKVDELLGGKDAAKAAGFYNISVSSRLTTTAISIYEDAA
jgi:predicted phage-related endonuclease